MENKDTVFGDSMLGKRLSKISRNETFHIDYKGKSVLLAVRISIGRDASNSIVLDDNLVSRKHAAIHKIKDDFFITDLGSKNGTRVNDKPVEPNTYVKLGAGDKIIIGRTSLAVS